MNMLSGLIGAVITLSIFILGLAFKLGQHSARLSALEEWRQNIRTDMHEISEKLEAISVLVTALKTLIEERTIRR